MAGWLETLTRVIVTGSRHLYPLDQAREIVAGLVEEFHPRTLMIVHGCCPLLMSVDWAFDRAAMERRIPVEQWHPEQFGLWPACGPRRNSAMVRAGVARGIAYHDNIRRPGGTHDCVIKMIHAGIPVDLYTGSGSPIRLTSFSHMVSATHHVPRKNSHEEMES